MPVAGEAQETQHDKQPQVGHTVVTGLAMIGGLGVSLIMVGLGIGVVLPDVDSAIVGLTVAFGAGLLVTGLGGWILAVRPHEHFDDINVPQYHGHHEEHHSEGEHSH